MVEQWLGRLPHSKKDPSSILLSDLFISHCSPRVWVDSLRALWLPPTVQRHAVQTGDTKLTISVNLGSLLAMHRTGDKHKTVMQKHKLKWKGSFQIFLLTVSTQKKYQKY